MPRSRPNWRASPLARDVVINGTTKHTFYLANDNDFPSAR